jgi:hypothetical protein
VRELVDKDNIEVNWKNELGVYYSGLRWQLYKMGNFCRQCGIIGGEGKIILK